MARAPTLSAREASGFLRASLHKTRGAPSPAREADSRSSERLSHQRDARPGAQRSSCSQSTAYTGSTGARPAAAWSNAGLSATRRSRLNHMIIGFSSMVSIVIRLPPSAIIVEWIGPPSAGGSNRHNGRILPADPGGPEAAAGRLRGRGARCAGPRGLRHLTQWRTAETRAVPATRARPVRPWPAPPPATTGNNGSGSSQGGQATSGTGDTATSAEGTTTEDTGPLSTDPESLKVQTSPRAPTSPSPCRRHQVTGQAPLSQEIPGGRITISASLEGYKHRHPHCGPRRDRRHKDLARPRGADLPEPRAVQMWQTAQAGALHSGRQRTVGEHPRGRRFRTGGYDPVTGKKLASIYLGGHEGTELTMTKDGKTIFVSQMATNTIWVVDRATRRSSATSIAEAATPRSSCSRETRSCSIRPTGRVATYPRSIGRPARCSA